MYVLNVSSSLRLGHPKQLNRSSSQAYANGDILAKPQMEAAEASEVRKLHFQGISAPEPTT